MASSSKTKVAILGGGVAGMTAAFELTATPELRDQYEVTLYQMGWRLGGKGASGRNAAMGSRIEEHGLHVWFGFYDNAFDLMRRCYEELDRREGSPLDTFETAFTPCDEIVLGEDFESKWLLHTFRVMRNPFDPGTVGGLPTIWDLVVRAIDWAGDEWATLLIDIEHLAGIHKPRPHWPALLRRAADAIEGRIELIESAAQDDLLAAARELCKDLLGRPRRPGDNRHHLLCELLKEFKDALWKHHASKHLDHAGLRNFAMMVDFFVTTLVGLVEDDMLGLGFDQVNDEELRAWLLRHGMEPYSVENSPVLRGFYSGGFAFEGGDKSKPNAAAGIALHAILRIFTYKDSILRKMQAGMGDTVFTPMYEVLVQRGVRFEFFQRVTKLGLSEDGTKVAAIEMVRQAEVLGETYQPFVTVNDLKCWPSIPNWSELRNGEALAASGINFEYGQDAPEAPAHTKHLGTDFDQIVLAIPVGALAPICGELIENQRTPEFAAMVANTATTMTQAFQLWTDETASEMGWTKDEDSILTAYIEPVDTYADMTHLSRREHWPAGTNVESIAYFCGVMPDAAGPTQKEGTDFAYASMSEFLSGDMGPIWGKTDDGGSAPFEWDVLVDPSNGVGPDRMKAQYWRANVQATERYTLSVAGSIKYRLAADESGYPNLVLAGDWIRNGINAGCVEATVMSGMQASRAISGQPVHIVGEDHAWLEGGRG